MLPDAVRQKANDYENCVPEIVREAIRTKGAISVGVPDKQTARGFFGDYQTFHQPDAVADMENVLYSQDAEYPVKGYHLTDLETPQDVTDYAIVIRFAGDATVEGDGFSDECISYHASAEAGQSFVLIDGKWADLSLPETAEALKLDFTPNNACIKAVYAK